MNGSFAISRSLIIYAICLPLAIAVGYFMADLQRDSVGLLVFLMSVLSLPLFIRWHHALMLASMNTVASLYFLPGGPTFWMLFTAISLFISLINRSVGQSTGFFTVRPVAYSLVALVAVALITAACTGGIGLRALGNETFGGKKYIFLLAGAGCFFAIAGQRLDPSRARWILALFFLPSLITLLGYVGAWLGLDSIYALFPSEASMLDAANETSVLRLEPLVSRYGGLLPAATGIFCYMLARHGVRGCLDIHRPWRGCILVLALVASMAGGFRSVLVVFFLTLMVAFCLEGLLRTRYAFVLVAGGLLACAVVLPFANKLPISIQRTLSFLPVNIDPMARLDAESSTEWRLEMWRELTPQVPRYFFMGKGYAIDPGELYMAMVSAGRGEIQASASIVSGDYHNGLFSLIIPFGIYGVLAFLWFLYASLRVLYRNYQFGDPALKTINTFLLAYFAVSAFSFFFIFGSIHSDLYHFASLIGLSVSLNGVSSRQPEPEPEAELADAVA